MINTDTDGYGNYLFVNIEDGSKRPECMSCGDDVKIVYHSGIPKYAQHCKECYAELMWGKIPKSNIRRKSL